MNFFELINKRESVRGYLDKPVEKEKIEKIIECARLSPSACNAQPWKFVVVNDKDVVEKVPRPSSVAAKHIFSQAIPISIDV